MTGRQDLQQSQAQYEMAVDALLSQLNDPNMDALGTLFACQEAAVSYAAALREASQDAHPETGEHYLELAQEIENGREFLLTTLLEYRERRFPQL